MTKLIPLITKYWYLLVIAVLFAVVALKKKKVSVSNKDEESDRVLDNARIRDQVAKDYYSNIALQLAQNLGTAYPWYDPRSWTENDQKVYELLQDLNAKDFQVISSLYFEVYAKGQNLSEDLAKTLDSKLYSLLRIK